MTRRKLSISMLGLGLLFLILNGGLKILVADSGTMSSPIIMLISLSAATPVFIGSYLIFRCQQALRNDEYQMQLLVHQLMFVSLATIGFMAAIGFWDGYRDTPAGLDLPHIKYILFWFVMWGISGFQKHYRE